MIHGGRECPAQKEKANTPQEANNVLHAWACALHTLATPLVAWRENPKTLLPPLLNDMVSIGSSQWRLGRNTDTRSRDGRKLRKAPAQWDFRRGHSFLAMKHLPGLELKFRFIPLGL
jgi:hypothetical protein